MKRLLGLKQLLAAALLTSVAGLSWLGAAAEHRGQAHGEMGRGPPQLPRGNSSPLVPVANAPAHLLAAVPPLPGPRQVDAKILVISADGQEADLPAITTALDYLGTPYTVWIATQRPQQLTPDMLTNGAHAFYQGVILTTASLGYLNGTAWTSALTPAEWSTLWSFESAFGVRQVTWYTYPTQDLGLGAATEQDTSTSPLNATLTPAGRDVFTYLNASSPVQFANAYCYKAAVTSTDTRALLVDSANNAIVSIHSYPDGRENLAITCDGAPFLVHSVSLSYGVINWVTRGVFLGYRRVYARPQVDDYFIETSMYSGGTYRMDAKDVSSLAMWQGAFRLDPLGADFRLEMAINGAGAAPGYWPGDTLVAATRQQMGQFKWTNHTFSHPNLDAVTYSFTTGELRQNLDAAAGLGLPSFSADALVTPEVSGLSNPEAMRAIRDIGIHWVVSDTSRAGQNNPKPNLGIFNALQPLVFEIPRRPTNLFYNVGTPSEWAAEYNAIYRGYWGRDLTYAEILDKESDVLLLYLLRGEMDPWMFHQANLRAYDGRHSLLGDLIDRVMAKYRARYNLPWVSPSMSDLGAEMANRSRYSAAGVTATLGASSITITAQRAAVVPVTGLNSPGVAIYGGQSIAFVPVAAGQSITLPLQ